MLEIIELKSRKLSDLQKIAKELKVPKFRSLKKLDLIYQILDYQAANPDKMKEILSMEDNTITSTPSPSKEAPQQDSKPKQPEQSDSSEASKKPRKRVNKGEPKKAPKNPFKDNDRSKREPQKNLQEKKR